MRVKSAVLGVLALGAVAGFPGGARANILLGDALGMVAWGYASPRVVGGDQAAPGNAPMEAPDAAAIAPAAGERLAADTTAADMQKKLRKAFSADVKKKKKEFRKTRAKSRKKPKEYTHADNGRYND